MSLRLRATTVTDVGLVRSNNEDAAHAGRHDRRSIAAVPACAQASPVHEHTSQWYRACAQAPARPDGSPDGSTGSNSPASRN